MNVDNLPDITNNKDLTQHFLYSYSHQSKIGPSEKIKNTFADDLIFDRSRKSIFAQNQEFGYICDKYVSIDMGSYYGSYSSYIDIFSYEGEINAYSFVPWYASGFAIMSTQLATSKVIALGTEIVVSSCIWCTNGSSKRLHFYENDPDNPIQYESITGTCKISYTLDGNNRIIDSSVISNVGNKTLVPSTNKIKADKTGKLSFELLISCSECPSIVSKQTIDDYEVANYFKVYTINYNSKSFEYIKDYLEADHSGVWVSYWDTVLNVLTNDIKEYTNKTPIQCNNGYRDYYCVCLPSRIHNANVLYGTLNIGSVQEFIKVNASDDVKESLVGNCNENYSIYLATNHSWNGSLLTFNNFKHI